MPKLFSNLIECLGFSHIIKSQPSIVSIALLDMSFKLPIGVATIYTPKSLLFINLLFIFIISCTPVNLSNKSQKADNNIKVNKPNYEIDDQSLSSEKSTKKSTNENEKLNDYDLNKNIAILISENDQEIFTKQLINIIELGVYNKNLKNVKFEILYYEDNKQLKEIISENNSPGKIFIGPIDNKNTKTAKSFCKSEIIFFSFSSEENLAGNCIYLINFFPKMNWRTYFLQYL